MLQDISVRPLPRNQIAQAYPLMKTICPEATEEKWQAFAETCLAREAKDGASGIMVATDGRGYVIGLYSYSVEEDFSHERVLEIDHFIAADFVGRGRVPTSLREAMERQARDLGCNAVHVTLPGTNGAGDCFNSKLIAGFREDGHCVEGLLLCKRL